MNALKKGQVIMITPSHYVDRSFDDDALMVTSTDEDHFQAVILTGKEDRRGGLYLFRHDQWIAKVVSGHMWAMQVFADG